MTNHHEYHFNVCFRDSENTIFINSTGIKNRNSSETVKFTLLYVFFFVCVCLTTLLGSNTLT